MAKKTASPKPNKKNKRDLSPPRSATPAPIAPRPVVAPKHIEAIPATGPGKASPAGPKSGVVVVGSLNMDLLFRTEVMPLPGQTVMGQDLLQNPGGKGANQATAVGRLWV